MLYISGKTEDLMETVQSVFRFFCETYEIKSDVEVFLTDLSEENALGFTEVNGDEQLVQVQHDLDPKEFATTLLHELVHVKQNEEGLEEEEEREEEAYRLESILFKQFTQTSS